MRITIEVHHTIKLDPALTDLLKTIFPNQAALDKLEKDITDKTDILSKAITDNKPAA